jgi:hypothetical protein
MLRRRKISAALPCPWRCSMRPVSRMTPAPKSEKNLRRMMQFAEVFPEEEIVVSLIRQLSWTHFIALLPIKNPLQRDFYAELCRVEGWSVSRLSDARGCFATHGGQLAQHHRCNIPVTAVPEISEPLCVPPSTI